MPRTPATPKQPPKQPPKMCHGCGFPKARCQCLELHLLRDIRAVGLPEPQREFVFSPTRKWRSDFGWPAYRLLVECEGGIFKGRHTSPAGYSRDVEKYSEASLAGYTVLRFTGQQIRGGMAIAMLERFFAGKERG